MAKLFNALFEPNVGGGVPSTFVLNSTNDAVGYVFIASGGNWIGGGSEAASVITHVGVVLAQTTGSPTVRVGIETMSAGVPSGTYLGGASAYAVVTPSGATAAWYWADLSAHNLLPTAGTAYCVTIRANGAVPDASNTVTVTTGGAQRGNVSVPYVTTITDGGAASNQNLRPQAAVWYARDSSGSYGRAAIEPGFQPIVSYAQNTSSQNLTTATTPDEMGTLWTQQVTSKIIGAYMGQTSYQSTSSTFDLILYEGSTQKAIVSGISPANMRATSTGQLYVAFSAPVVLTQGRQYRLTVRPSTANYLRLETNVYPLDPTGASAEPLRAAFFGEGQQTVRTDGGSWTDEPTKSCTIIPLLEAAFTTSGVAGGGNWF